MCRPRPPCPQAQFSSEGTWPLLPSLAQSTPSPPSVTIRHCPVFPCRASSSAFTSAGLSTGRPESRANSVSLAITMSASGARRSTASVSGAMLRMLHTPLPAPLQAPRARRFGDLHLQQQGVSRRHRGDRVTGILTLPFRWRRQSRRSRSRRHHRPGSARCRWALKSAYAAKVGTGRRKKRQRLCGESIIAGGARHPHRSACAPGRQRLIGALAARGCGEIGSGHGFARRRADAVIIDVVCRSMIHVDVEPMTVIMECRPLVISST
jgi:hypothetical protein